MSVSSHRDARLCLSNTARSDINDLPAQKHRDTEIDDQVQKHGIGRYPCRLHLERRQLKIACRSRGKPLALYFFSEDRERQEQVLRRLSSGGACINDTFAQLVNLRLPFGGVGDSGMGSYHGRAGFKLFPTARAW
ncbi:MAG TPA: aldehyde dehydrogenase family protein [Hyphomicrobiaceae bacterium]|nr:aldehyde dehydrogenase family protein [Hyphomicrobiaceae bacterium]